MQFSIPINTCEKIIRTKSSVFSSNRSMSLILNVILSLVFCIFILSFINFLRQEKRISIIHKQSSNLLHDESNTPINLTRDRGYYDFQQYLINNTFEQEKKLHRFFYIDLGCFDGRDADYFFYFHNKEVSHMGNLSMIAFEPDPINLSACKSALQKHSSIPTIIYDKAVWIKDGEVQYALEKGQKSKIDPDSALSVPSIDFSKWLKDNFVPDDFVYVKFTVEGAEIPILEKLVYDETLALIDNMEIEWSKGLSRDLEPRRVSLECMFDNFGMDFIYTINPVDLKHSYNTKDTFEAIPKDRTWRLKDPYVRFYYRTRKAIPLLLAERLRRKPKVF